LDPRDLKRILDALVTAGVNEFSLETPDYKLNLKRGPNDALVPLAYAPAASAPAQAAAPASMPAPTTSAPAQAAPALAPAAAPAAPPKGTAVKAPIVGTFYRAPSPDAPSYVEVGDRVEAGKVLCIIEAMKLMNEIESDVSGVVRQILVTNGEPVEFGQPLFIIE
jgi:acetyl-CoA carboxylase biotin carboxyl carrier protein